MPIGKVGQRGQVVIPKSLRTELGLHEGDFVEVTIHKGTVLIKPKKVVDPEEVLTSEDRESIRRGFAQLKQGKSVPWEDVKKRLKL